MKILLIPFFIFMAFYGYTQTSLPMIVNKDALQKLANFKVKKKFEIEKTAPFYQGLSNPSIQPKLNELLNKAADDFIATVKTNPSEKKFLDNIKTGLERFDAYYLKLDTEDREKTCTYFEELMDCVGLPTSGGQLNKWMYGFDPIKKN